MLRRTVTSFVLTGIAVLATAAPAAAIPTLPPPGPDHLWVTAYYSSPQKLNSQLVGQRWSGCGDPADSWGAQTSYWTVFHPTCDWVPDYS